MKTVLRILFGSHLYGTATPASDMDFKSIFIPPARDILLQRVKNTINNDRPKAQGEKNVAGEIDEEALSLQKFLQLLADGQVMALDMLFAPRDSWIDVDKPIWGTIVENKHRLLTKKSAAFVDYCRAQANKYGIKGSRVAAARKALEVLNEITHGGEVFMTSKLGDFFPVIDMCILENQHMQVHDQTMTGGTVVRHWEVCGRKMPYTSSVKTARDNMQRLVDEYGHRALQAEKEDGVDWKALSHAVRVGMQALELFETGEIQFPLTYAPHLVRIKTGQLPYKEVANEIEGLLEVVEKAAARSDLPAEPDVQWMDDFVAQIHTVAIWGML